MTVHTSDGFSDLSLDIVSVSHESPFELFWGWYRQTWIDLQDVPYDPNNPEHVDACVRILERRALPTPQEVLTFDVAIRGLSRVALAQITRGRVGHAYNVESQMPQHIRHSVTVPLSISSDERFAERARRLAEESAKLYDEMYDAGIPPQDCRYMTLHGQQTSLRWHVNYAALRGFFSLRCENGLTDELNLVGRLLRRQLVEMFTDVDPTTGELSDKVHGSGWSELIKRLDCMGGRNVCLNEDRVFGNTGRARSASDRVPRPGGEVEPDYDFTRSAWYMELQRLPDDLLLPGEREMIDDWRTIGFERRLRKLHGG